MKSPPTRVALYSRVSTTDKGQEVENQLLQLRQLCASHGYQIRQEYIDHESGSKGKKERAAFAELFEAAAQRKFDLVIFWSLDRFSREGIRKTIHYLQQLDGYGVRFKSYTESYLDTDNELVSHILLGVLSYFAELEAKRISERTKAALARKKAQGVILGQPSKYRRFREPLIAMSQKGLAKKEMARQTGLSVQTIRKYLRMIDDEKTVAA